MVPVARGTEEIELATLIGVLRRAEAEVVVAKVTRNGQEESLATELSRGMVIQAETRIEDLVGEEFDAISCAGGAIGSVSLGKDTTLINLLKE